LGDVGRQVVELNLIKGTAIVVIAAIGLATTAVDCPNFRAEFLCNLAVALPYGVVDFI
jgi:hypothetical protein